MRRTTRLVLSVLSLAAIATQPARACDVTVGTGDDVVAAVASASPGAVVCLQAGEYRLRNTIVIASAVELRGPGCGTDPRAVTDPKRRSGGPDEAVLHGSGLDHLISIQASGAKVCGLELKDGRDQIVAGVVADVEIRDNIASSSTDDAVRLVGCSNCKVVRNRIFDTDGDGVTVCCGSTQATVEGNEIHHVKSSNAAVYLYGPGGEHTVAGNYIHHTRNDGVKLGASDCRGLTVPNTKVAANLIADTDGDGITVYSSGAQVLDNEVTRSRSPRGAVYVACADTRDVAIRGNNLHGNRGGTRIGEPTFAVRIGPRSGSRHNPDPTSIVLTRNCITDNGAAVANFSRGNLTAADNWWGEGDAQKQIMGAVTIAPTAAADCKVPDVRGEFP